MSRLTGVKETDLLILMELDDYDLNRACRVDKYARYICEEPSFWLDRMVRYLKLNLDEISNVKNYLKIDSNKELYIYLTRGLLHLDNETLFKIFLGNKYIKRISDNENFWKKRTEIVYPKLIEYKSRDESWKKYYLQIVTDITSFEDPWDFFSGIHWDLMYKPKLKNVQDLETMSSISSRYKLNNFYYLNLGKNVKIAFPYGSSSMLDKESFSSNKYFTPEDILTKIYNYYQELLTEEEYEEWLEDEPLGMSEIKFKKGETQRIDLFGNQADFSSLKKIGNTFYLTVSNEFGTKLADMAFGNFKLPDFIENK